MKHSPRSLLVKAVLFLPMVIVMAVLLIPAGPSSPTLAQCTSTTANISLHGGSFLSSANNTHLFDIANVSIYSSGSQPYICDNGAAIPQFSLPTYAEMKTYYYDKKPDTKKQELTDSVSISTISFTAGTPTHPGDRLYHVPGNLVIDANADIKTSPYQGIKVFFVDGDLFFQSDLNQDSAYSGFIFIVQGNVWVHHSAANTINGIIIAYQKFCSAWDPASPDPPACAGPVTVGQPLIVNGSLIYISNGDPADKPTFVRRLDPNPSGAASEQFVYQPKFLVIIKDLFASTLTIWTEIQ